MKFRPDIEGLRGLLILMAVSFHLGVPYLEGGFISVDQFFVISGFLITSLLAGEFAKSEAAATGSGTISLKRFYYRRVRRILPVAVFIIIVTVCAGYFLFNPLRSKMVAYNAVWALLFCANINAIQQFTDYFQEGLPTSPLLHYWSLAVEEQFYFFWPLLFLISARNSLKLPLLARLKWEQRVLIVIGLIGLASYGWSIFATHQNSRGAYFSTLTRTFELAAGAVVAMTVRSRPVLAPGAKLACSLLAISILVGATLAFKGLRSFPGYLGLLPTLSAALFILAGIPSTDGKSPIINRLLSKNPWRSIGTLSYSVYLWHFPVILALRDINPMVGKSGLSMALIMLVILLLSVLSFFLIEKPCRIVSPHHEIETIFDPLFKGSTMKRALVSVGGLVLSGVLFALILAEAKRPGKLGTRHAVEHEGGVGTSAQAGPSSAALLPLRPDEERVLAAWRSDVAAGLELKYLPASLIPLQPHLEKPLGLLPPCHDIWNPRYPIEHLEECASGDVNAPKKIAIVGDSRAGAWVQALRGALDPQKWRLYPLTRGHSCGWSYRNTSAPASFNCPGLFDDTISVLEQLHPDVLILTEVGFGDRTIFRKRLEQYLPAAEKVIIVSNLQGQPTFQECLGKDNSIERCYVKLFDNHGSELRSGVEGLATIVDVEELFCHNRRCPALIGNTPVFYDGNHFSREMADKLALPLKILLRRVGVE
jgi:peptidoglycan/LPS O-acetylase OafA/YrhL